MYFQLGEADQARYGGPKWLRLVPEDLMDCPASRLAEWEREMFPITLLSAIGERRSAASMRCLMWLARKFVPDANFEDEKLSQFDPAVLRARFMHEPPEEDQGKALPPSEPSEESSETAP